MYRHICISDCIAKIIYLFKYKAKGMYLENLKRLMILNGGSTSYEIDLEISSRSN